MNYLRVLWQLYQQKLNTKKTRRQIKTLQKRKLDKLLTFAYAHSPYYRKAFEKAGITADNITKTPLSKFPTLTKQQLIDNYDELVTERSLKQKSLLRFDENNAGGSRPYRGKYHVVHSSGSTGTPRYFVYDNSAWEQMLIGIIRGALWDLSMTQTLKLLAGKPRILYIAATDGRYGGAMAVSDGINGVRAQQRSLDINTPLSEWIATLRQFRPDIIIGYPSAIKILAEQMRSKGVKARIKRIVSCGEPLSQGLRRYLESTFNATVLNFYGASESLALGVEQHADEGMFLFDDLNIVEVIDGEMYVTCLYNFTQPLIRYHISDRLVLRKPKRSDKCSFTKADVLLCRNEDVLWFETKGGRREYLHPLSVEGFCVDGLIDYQFRQTSKGSFEITAEITSLAVREKVRAEMNRLIKTLLHKNGLEGVTFSIRFVDKITADTSTGKKPLIIRSDKFGGIYNAYQERIS